VAAEVGEPRSAATVGRPRRRGRVEIDRQLLEAIDQATVEALAPGAAGPGRGKDGKSGRKGEKSDGKGSKRRRSATPPPAVNEPLAFINFVAAFPVGNEVEGEVESFTSHGAMVDVEVPGGATLHCYIPLAGLGDPPPHKAREVLRRGDRRLFVLVDLDPSRRMAELALPEVRSAEASGGRPVGA
jgi:hypothetical protein